MPLVARNNLPTYDRLRAEGRTILSPDRASQQDVRPLHIGFINMMPDAVIQATERQFFRLINESSQVVQIHMHPLTLPVISRAPETQDYLDNYYQPFESIKAQGLDALIITGASEESNPHVSDSDYWAPVVDALEWAKDHVTSTICSCMAAHVALAYTYGQEPEWRTDKRFGIFEHRVLERQHPMVSNINTRFFAPHARHSEISREQFETAGMPVLIDSDGAGVHIATTPDGFRLICMQGHPEYDSFSLLKEYRREVQRFVEGVRPDYPTFPEHYFDPTSAAIAQEYQDFALAGRAAEKGDFPEDIITSRLDNTWRDSARSMMSAWIGLVYRTTNADIQKQYMDGIDPADPLGWHALKNAA